jgi:hypothetical protein
MTVWVGLHVSKEKDWYYWRRVHRPLPPPRAPPLLPPPLLRPPLLRLEEPRLLSALALEPLLEPPKAPPEEEALGFACEDPAFACEALALGDAVGRLALAEGAGREAESLPVDGRTPALPVEGEARFAALGCVDGPAPPEP